MQMKPNVTVEWLGTKLKAWHPWVCGTRVDIHKCHIFRTVCMVYLDQTSCYLAWTLICMAELIGKRDLSCYNFSTCMRTRFILILIFCTGTRTEKTVTSGCDFTEDKKNTFIDSTSATDSTKTEPPQRRASRC